MSQNAQKIKAVFLAALDHTGDAERTAFLDEACGTDVALRQGVEALLRAHGRGDPLLDRPAADHLAGMSNERAGPNESLSFLAPPSRPDSLGRIGHYEVLQVLGNGGFGIVFRAFDDTLQRVVAVKVLAPHLAATSPARKRFLREARSSAKVRHENVVQIYAVEESPLPYLVMEFIPGETLQQRLDRTGPLETAEVLDLGRQIAGGLAAAHATGLIHRDIKPANILIEAGPHPRAKITDFGLARAADDASLTQSGLVAGTPMYMAPEQALGNTLDHRSDLFSLGSVLYAMSSGRPPFRASNPLAVLKRVAEDTPRPIPEITPEVPRWLCDVISKLHAKKPEGRFASAQEVADLLAKHLARLQHSVDVPTVADVRVQRKSRPPSETSEFAPREPRPRIRRWAVGAAAFLMLIGGFGLTEATGVTNVRGTVVRLFFPTGTLVVEVDDPGVSVRIDGSELVITGAGAKEIRLKPGSYTVEARKGDKVVSRELVSVVTDGRQVVRVSQEAPPPEVKADDGAADRRAAEFVLASGGEVCLDDAEARVAKVNGDARLPVGAFRLTTIVMERKQLGAADWAVFGGCKNLTTVYLDAVPVDAAALAHFKNCENLVTLSLVGSRVTDDALEHLKDRTKLRKLDLYINEVGDAGLAHLKNLKDLRFLRLGLTRVSDAGLEHFKGCKELASLSLNHAQVGDAGLAHFAGCKQLKELSLGETQVTDAGLAHFKGCKDLTELIVFKTSVGDAGLAHLKDCKELTSVWLWDTQVTDATLAVLKGCANLKELRLGNTQVTDDGLAHLKECKNLAVLNLKDTKVTPAGVATLKQALPNCKVDLTER